MRNVVILAAPDRGPCPFLQNISCRGHDYVFYHVTCFAELQVRVISCHSDQRIYICASIDLPWSSQNPEYASNGDYDRLRRDRDFVLVGSSFPEPPSSTFFEYHLIGSMMDEYPLLELLGKGGMGWVYRSLHKKYGYVAIKVVTPSIAMSEQGMGRIAREFDLQRSISIPGVVRSFDLRKCGNWIYFVFELIEGVTFLRFVVDNELSIHDRCMKLSRLAHIVSGLHELGIWHRDIKPTNVLVDSRGDIHLTDFGIARATGGALAVGQQELTEIYRSVVGAPNYWSPDRCTPIVPENLLLAQADDVWSLGITACEIISSGHLPFNLSGLSIIQTFFVLSKAIPVCPHEVPEELWSIILRALDKNWGSRCTAKEFGDLLEAYANKLPNEGGTPGSL